jgi:hypothetical protein
VRDELVANAFAAIDAANGADPARVLWDGSEHPKAELQGRRASFWLQRLAPGAPAATRIAVRAHHLRRFAIPRSSYPEGRAGYHRWRSAQKAAVARELAALLGPIGVPDDVLERAISVAQRTGLGSDPGAQLVEDCACLVFCETDLEELAGRIGEDKTIDAIAKTLRKMSAAAIALAGEATPAHLTHLLAAAAERS